MILEAAARVLKNSLEDFDHIEHANVDPRFFGEFSPHTFHQCFAHFERSTGNGPLAFERRTPAANQERTIAGNHDAAHSHHRALRVFATSRHLYTSLHGKA